MKLYFAPHNCFSLLCHNNYHCLCCSIPSTSTSPPSRGMDPIPC